MKPNKLNLLRFLSVGISSFSVLLFIGQAVAAPLVFTVDDTQSQITLSGNIAGYPLTAQSAGSLTTTYSGNINANVSGSTIQFTGLSTVIAKTNGVWQPAVGGGAGSAPADYGAKASLPVGTGYGAARSVVLDVASPLLTLTGTNFDSSALVFSFATGSGSTFDWNAGFAGNGTLSLTGNSTNSVANGASLTTNGNVLKLVIQINAQFAFKLLSPGDTPLNLTGQIVATSQTAAPTIISSIVLANQNVVLTVQNATAQSQLQVSTNLMFWSPASASVSNYLDLTIFTTPLSGPKSFYRVQK